MYVRTDPRPLQAAISRAFDRSAEEVVGLARENAPVAVSRGMKLNAGSNQGSLRASITREPTKHDGSGYHTRIGSPLRYAMMREFGGTIVAVRAKYLKWRDPATGRWYQKRSVTQRPGGPRQGYKPWLRPAGDRWPDLFLEHLRAIK